MPGEKNVDVEKKTSRARETTDVEAGKWGCDFHRLGSLQSMHGLAKNGFGARIGFRT